MLTDTLNTFVHAFNLRYSAVAGHATNLLKYFILIELVLFGIYFAIEGGDLVASLFKKVLLIGSFQLLVSSFPWFVDTIRDSFVAVGLANSGSDSAKFLDPSWFIGQGFDMVSPLWKSLSLKDVFMGAGLVILVYVALTIIVLVAFVLMGLQIFLTQLEFYILTTLAVILLPFGLFRPTAFLADKAIGAIFTISIKLMVLAFVASVALPVLSNITISQSTATTTTVVHGLPVDVPVGPLPLKQTLMAAIAVVAIAMVFRKAPTMAASLVSASSGLDVGPIIHPMRHAAGAATQATQLAAKIGGAIATGGTSAAVGAAAGAVGQAAASMTKSSTSSSTSPGKSSASAGSSSTNMPSSLSAKDTK